MREIKYRAWDKLLRKWKTIEETAKCVEYAIMYSNPEDIELMQYTGLKDKNGTGIFEGDIVSQSGYTGLVDFYEGSFYKKETNRNVGRGSKQMLLSQCASRSEIIGNIYENPELLK